MSKVKTHKDLEIWQLGIELVTRIYTMTSDFPKEELYGLISQMRRAAVSIPSNIAEGAARNSNKEFLQFLYISLASLSELETQLIISKNLMFLTDSKPESIELLRRKMLNFIKYLKNK
jgi:four helix bundle protein